MDSGPNQRFMVLTRQGPVLAHNCVQSAARNALCEGLLILRPDFPYILHVHDEILLVVERTTAEVRRARDALVRVFGPGGELGRHGWGWSVLINPADITISQSLYEDEAHSKAAWPRVDTGDETALEGLP